MTVKQKQLYSKILNNIAENLDVTKSQYELAKERYEAVGKFLDKEGSSLHHHNPIVFPQGSFRLGTVVKPYNDCDQFDVDLVCLLQIASEETSQAKIKTMVGDRLKEDKNYARMLEEEKRRCWTLLYAEASRFHLDILPAIPDPNYKELLRFSVLEKYAKEAILITDRGDGDVAKYEIDWPKSNPAGYALWFQDRMGKIYSDAFKGLEASVRMEVQPFQAPSLRMGLPLQRAIQLLKRHRDLMFEDDEDKPISIIITTLATHSYQEENNTYDALLAFFERAERHIKKDFVTGYSQVLNPVDPRENFADKWQETPRKKENFFKWLIAVKRDILEASRQDGLYSIANSLKEPFGEQVVMKSMNSIGEEAKIQREAGKLSVSSAGIVGASGTKITDHTFFGGRNES